MGTICDKALCPNWTGCHLVIYDEAGRKNCQSVFTDLGVVWTPEIFPPILERHLGTWQKARVEREGYSSPLAGCSAIMRNVPEAGVGRERELHCKATR